MSRTWGQYTKIRDLPINLPKGAMRNWRWITWYNYAFGGTLCAEGSRHIRHHGRGGRTHCSCRKKYGLEENKRRRIAVLREISLEIENMGY